MQFTKRECNITFAVLLTASMIGSFLQTSLTTALPAMMNDFHITASTGQWLTSAYSLAIGIMVPATAFLIKRFSTRTLFITSMSISSVGNLLAIVTGNFYVLLLGRIMQALAAGIMLSLTQVVVLTIYPVEKRGTMMGIYGLAAGAAPVIAPTIAGLMIDMVHWRMIFIVAFALSTSVVCIAIKVMKNVTVTQRISFDAYSMILCAIGFSGILLAFGNFGTQTFFSSMVALPLAVGVLGIALFCQRQLSQDQPFLDLRILKEKDYLMAVIISMLLYMVMMAGSTLFPIYIQSVKGLSATMSGFIMMPGSLVMAMISPFAGKCYDRFGIRKLVIGGSICMVISCLGVSFVDATTSSLYLAALYIIRLVAIGLIMMPIVTWGMSVLHSSYTAHGTALLTSLRTISGAIGSAVFVSIMSSASAMKDHTAIVNSFGIDTAFICISVVAMLQLFVSIAWVGRTTKQCTVSA